MRNADTIVPNTTLAIRWIARIGGAILIIFVVGAVMSEDKVLKLSGLKTGELVMTLSLLFAVLGLLIGWFWEGLGGLLTIAGLITFSIVNYYSGGDFAWEIWILSIPAILFIFYWWRTR
jgi:hypothetical protein